MKKRSAARRTMVLGTCIALTLAAAAWLPAAAGSPRISVDVNEPFVIDGRVFPAGTLSLRTVSEYTPSSTIDEIRVEGTAQRLAMTQRTLIDSRVSSDQVTFARDAEGRLVLTGYVRRDGSRTGLYRLVSFEAPDSGSRSASGPVVASR